MYCSENLNKIINISRGDLRKVVNLLQNGNLINHLFLIKIK